MPIKQGTKLIAFTTDDLTEGSTNKYDTGVPPSTTDDLTEGSTNKYDTGVPPSTTDDLTEGSTNKYDTGVPPSTTDDLTEGSTNKYDTGVPPATTDDLTEGSTNKYDTGVPPATTDDLTEGSTNKYDTGVPPATTDDLAEGSTNKYCSATNVAAAGAAILAGKSGGQTLNGGIAASENLTLNSSSHATKGKIFLGSNSAYDETNKNLGIGTTSPIASATLNLYNAASGGKIRIQNSATGVGASDGFSFELGGTEAYIWNFEDSVLYFGTNNVVRLKILANGVIQRYNNGGTKIVNQKIDYLQTINDTTADLTTIAIAEGETVFIEAKIVARKSDGSQHALYNLKGLFYRNAGGNVTQQGSTLCEEIESDTDWNADLVVDTVNQTVDVRVTGKAATTINWKCDVMYQTQ